MRQGMCVAALTAVTVAATSFFSTVSSAASFEQTPTFDAQQLLPQSLLENPYYKIQNPVVVDNYQYVFTVDTQWGTFRIAGTNLLRVRAREMAATAKLQDIESADTAVEAAGRAVKKPLNTIRGLFNNPSKTISDTAKGVGDLVDSFEASLDSIDPHKEGAIASVTGAAKARRELAYDLGVDPYTSFKALDVQLTRLARASAIGSTGVGLGFSAIGGGVGVAISASSTSQSLREALRDQTAAQLEEQGRQSLAASGVSILVVSRFFGNPYLTPTDKVVIVTALGKLGKVDGREIYVDMAANAESIEMAFYYRRQSELILDYAEKIAPVTAFIRAGGVPMVQTEQGTVSILPVDYIYWSAPIEGLASSARGEMLITGVASPLATEQIGALGWTLTPNAVAQLD